MSRAKLAKGYGELTPRERLCLVVDAMARDDLAESNRIYGAAPLRDYRLTDPAFTGPYRALQFCVVMVASDLRATFAQLQTLRAYNQLVPSLLARAAIEGAAKLEMATTAEELIQAAIVDPPPKPPPRLAAADTAPDQMLSKEQAEAVRRYLSRDALTEFKSVEARGIDTLASAASCVYHAFDNFCRRVLARDGATVLRAWFPALLADLERWGVGAIQPEPEAVKEYESVLVRGWNQLA